MSTNKNIKIEARNVYGNQTLYVVSEHAEAIKQLTGKRTIDKSDIRALESLGFMVTMNALPDYISALEVLSR